MNYASHTAKDFALDDYFVQWVRSPDAETDAFWENWLAGHPEKRAEVEEARLLVGLMHFREDYPTAEETQAARQRLSETIRAEAPRRTARTVALPGWSWQRVAAALVVLLVAGVVLFALWNRLRTTVYETAYGQTRSLTLPDGSAVVLNAHSRLELKGNWLPGRPREVWLDGEAFFEVRHTPENARFVVYAEGVQVEVLGTAFNVWQRQDQAKVVLSRGSIRLTAAGADGAVVMKPGELVTVTAGQRRLEPRVVNAEKYTSWKDNKLLFDGTPVREVIGLIETNYGYRVTVTDPALLDRRFTYTLAGNDLDLLLNTLAESLNLQIDKSGRTITVQPAADGS